MDTVLTGDEHIMFDGMPTGYLLHDFWAWASSDLLNNTLRGSYAEFIVAAALDLTDMLKTPRKDWTAYDLYYPLDRKTGIRIEVKSAAYLQAWGEKDSPLSKIQFSIRPTLAWDAENGYDTISRHQSDVYVFCVYTEKERCAADPLNLDGWDFYVLPTSVLNQRCPTQKSISLASLEKLDPFKTDYDGLEAAVIEAYKFPVFTPPPSKMHKYDTSFHILFGQLDASDSRAGASQFYLPVAALWYVPAPPRCLDMGVG